MKVVIDVTNSCTSVQNTGTQRTTRKIFAELNECVDLDVQPICWNRVGNFYSGLGERELRLLTRPFDVRSHPMARPEWHGRDPLNEFRRFLGRRLVRIEKQFGAGDLFFVPEIFRDGRCRTLSDFAKRTQARTIAIFHDAADLRLRELYGDRERKARPYLEALARFDLVICVSEEARDDLHHFWKKYGCPQTQTCVESWPVELDSELVGSGLTSPGKNIVLYVSSFQRRKNHVRLLRAAEQLWQQGLTFELHLIGRNVGLPMNRVVREIWKLQMRGHPLRWLRHVNETTLARAYRECRFTVYPSLMEGFGLPILESLACGKPCVCGGNGALGEVARRGGCLIVDQTNEDALATGLAKLLRDHETYTRLCAEARLRNFRSWADYKEQLVEHFGVPTLTAELIESQ